MTDAVLDDAILRVVRQFREAKAIEILVALRRQKTDFGDIDLPKLKEHLSLSRGPPFSSKF